MKIPYDQYVKKYILAPLKIASQRTGIRIVDFQNIDDLVTHYAYAYNDSFLQLWNREMSRLNISQMKVNISI